MDATASILAWLVTDFRECNVEKTALLRRCTFLEGCKDAKFNRTENDISERESIELNTQFILLIAHLGDGVIINLGYLMFWPSQSRLASLQSDSHAAHYSDCYVSFFTA